MEQYAGMLWIVLGVVLIVAEIFTLGFVLLGFGIGALAAALAGFLGAGFIGQFLIFALVSVVMTVFSRSIFAGFYSPDDENKIKTGSESLPGQIGTVTSASSGPLQSGEVKVFGSTWRAFPEVGEMPLAEGEKVEVVRIEGASIYVRRVGRLPEWREKS
jgi:membrane protein implicated in regulation of membrane protease activity